MLLPLHAAAIWLCLLVTHVLGAKYWIDSQSCGERYQDALAEAISIAAEIHEVLHYKEEFESSADEWFETAMAWMFGFGVKDAMADKASLTFGRIGSLVKTEDRLSAEIRIYCDDDDRYKIVDENLNFFPGNFPLGKTVRYYDIDNDAIVYGATVGCKNEAGTLPAYNFVDVGEMRKNVFPKRAASGDLVDRVMITICQTLKDALENQVGKARAFTWEEFAQKKLQNLSQLQIIHPNMAETFLHELVHSPILSNQGSDIPHSHHARDKHPPDNAVKNGYNALGDTKYPGERLKPYETVMNPDSYARLATIYALRKYGWHAYREEKTEFIRFKKVEAGDGKTNWN